MPSYQYECECCKAQEEWWGKYSERPESLMCTRCVTNVKEGLMFPVVSSNTGFILKGKDWYRKVNNK